MGAAGSRDFSLVGSGFSPVDFDLFVALYGIQKLTKLRHENSIAQFAFYVGRVAQFTN